MNAPFVRLRYLSTRKPKSGWGTKFFTRLNYWLLVKLSFTFLSFSLIFCKIFPNWSAFHHKIKLEIKTIKLDTRLQHQSGFRSEIHSVSSANFVRKN